VSNARPNEIDRQLLNWVEDARLRCSGRVCQGLSVDETQASLALREAVRMLYLVSSGRGGVRHSISRALDEAWHALILETRFYHDLCAILPSGQFIHHSGAPSIEVGEPEIAAKLELLSSYVGFFGPFEEAVTPYWPGVRDLLRVFNIDLATLNHRLSAIHTCSTDPSTA
jgi:hypothetical protein